MIALEVLSGSLRGQRFLIRSQLHDWPRSPQQHRAPDVHLSSEHAQIFREDDKFIFRICVRPTVHGFSDATEPFITLMQPRVLNRWSAKAIGCCLGIRSDPVILGCVLSDNQLAPMTVPPGGSSPTVPALQLGRAAPAPPVDQPSRAKANRPNRKAACWREGR